MSAQPVTMLETIEHLDFEPETPCEHSWHQDTPPHAADLLIRVTKPCCGRPGSVIGICFDMWNVARTIRCRCGHRDERGYFWTVLEVLS